MASRGYSGSRPASTMRPPKHLPPPNPGIPPTLKVGAWTIDVSERPYLEMDRNGVYGRYQSAASLIELRTDLGDQHTRDTLLHEALHAVLYTTGIKDMLSIDDELEERLVSGLTPALLSLLRDNPDLTSYLTA